MAEIYINNEIYIKGLIKIRVKQNFTRNYDGKQSNFASKDKKYENKKNKKE